MALETPQLPAQHVTPSMKVFMLVFAVVLIVTLSWFVWDNNMTADDSDNSAPNVKQEAVFYDINDYIPLTQAQKDELAAIKIDGSWTEYKNIEKGFSVSVPATWIVTERSGGVAIASDVITTDILSAFEEFKTKDEAADHFRSVYKGTSYQLNESAVSPVKVNELVVPIVEVKIQTENKITLNTITAFIFEGKNSNFLITLPKYHYFTKADHNFEFVIAKEYKRLDLAIQTFKFIE